MPIIALAGIKHSGKSTVGRIVSEKMDGDFQDLDDLILKHLPFKWSVRKWYREKGKQAFQEKESAALSEYLQAKKHSKGLHILALGGACLENGEALALLKASGCGILVLDDTAEVLLERILKKGIPPFLDPADPAGSFQKLYNERRQTLLKEGDHIISIEGLNQSQSAEKVEQIIRRAYGRQ